MKISIMRPVLVLIILIVATLAWSGNGLSQYFPPAIPAGPPAEGYTILNEYYLPALMEEPERCFHRARENFIKKELKIAAEDIRKATVYLRLEAGRSTDEGKEILLDSIRELDELAAKIEKGSAPSVKELDKVFSRAHQSLAKQHYLKAVKIKTDKGLRMIGQDLKAMAYHLERAIIWDSDIIDTPVKTIIEKARLVAEQLANKKATNTKAVNDILNSTGKEIGKLEHKKEK